MFLIIIMAFLFSRGNSLEKIKRDLNELTGLSFERNDSGYINVWMQDSKYFVEFCGERGLNMYMHGIASHTFKDGVMIKSEVQKKMEMKHPGVQFVFGTDY